MYGADSICIEVNTTQGDCLPMGGTPRCYQRQVVQQNGVDQLAFSISVRGKQMMITGMLAIKISTQNIFTGRLGSTHWCRDSEVLRTTDGFLFCPSQDEILLRVEAEDISTVQQLPEPGTQHINMHT